MNLPPVAERSWFLSRDGQQFGPIPQSELPELLKSGRVAYTDLLWSQGLSSWMPAHEVFGIKPPAPPPSTSLPQPSTFSAGRIPAPSSSQSPIEPAVGTKLNSFSERSGPRKEMSVTQTVIEGGSFKFGTFVLIVAGLIIPLWPISLPICWYLAYRSYQKPVERTVRTISH